ncbi:hypothetical protein P4B35_13585 [Pontiellaceae bacterium B12227]|nr:hypothetical protein [Pontiellaceae bacterium B12227]
MRIIVTFIGCFFLFSGLARGETNEAFELSFPRWASSMRGGSVYNFDADLEGGGSFYINRFVAEAMFGRMWSYDSFLAVSIGGGQDDYHFSEKAFDPWNNINNYRVGLYGQWKVSDKWSLFAAPSVRAYAEAAVDPLDGLTGNFFGGASYTFSDRLSLGPALAITGQIADDTRYYPVLLVNWKISESLSLDTGGGLAATAGPGLALVYEFSKHWKAGITTRYERKRFRLNHEGIAPNGVGEDRNIPIYGTLAYFFYPQGYITAIFGYNAYGKLALYDEQGRYLDEYEYDPSASLGFVASFRF